MEPTAPVTGPDVLPNGAALSPVRTNAPATAPQRAPKFPDTPWGRLRGGRGWSLRELSRHTGVNPADLSRIERGFGPTPAHARLLLAAYDEAGESEARRERPSPHELWQQANGDRDRYLDLMREHGHIVPGPRKPGTDIFGHQVAAGPRDAGAGE